jgi:hypothetical protein
MRLNDYYDSEGDGIHFSRRQASDFAKSVAGDFNPIHDIDSKRFCVPGDLLFSVALKRYGLSRRMRVMFSGMVGDEVTLEFPPLPAPDVETRDVEVRDTQGRPYLRLECAGPTTTDPRLVDAIIQCYVRFSGQTFPQILVPLMSKHQLMINPDRPLIIYESMSIELQHMDFEAPQLELTDATLNVAGKRGEALLNFAVKAGDRVIGAGSKTMLLSGLRPFAADRVETLVNDYMARKNSFVVSG